MIYQIGLIHNHVMCNINQLMPIDPKNKLNPMVYLKTEITESE